MFRKGYKVFSPLFGIILFHSGICCNINEAITCGHEAVQNAEKVNCEWAKISPVFLDCLQPAIRNCSAGVRNDWLSHVEILELTMDALKQNGSCYIECLHDDSKKAIMSNCSKWYDGMAVTSQHVLTGIEPEPQLQEYCLNLREIDNCIEKEMSTMIGHKLPSRDCKDLIEFVRQLKASTNFDAAVKVCQEQYIWPTLVTVGDTFGPKAEESSSGLETEYIVVIVVCIVLLIVIANIIICAIYFNNKKRFTTSYGETSSILSSSGSISGLQNYRIPRPTIGVVYHSSEDSKKKRTPNLMGVSRDSPVGSLSRELPKSWTLGPSWTTPTRQTSDSAEHTEETRPTSFTRSPDESSLLRKKEYDEQQILLDMFPDDLSAFSPKEQDNPQAIVDGLI